MKKIFLIAITFFLLASGVSQAKNPPLPEPDAYPPSLRWYPAKVTPAEGVIITLHGGGWKGGFGNEAHKSMREGLENKLPSRWAQLNVAYRSGGEESMIDVRNAYAQAAKRFGNKPICAWGGSAGAELAVTLAFEEDGLDCVIGEGSPVNLFSGNGYLQPFIDDYFDPDTLVDYSPLSRVRYDSFKSRTLLAVGTDDPFINPLDVEKFASIAQAKGMPAKAMIMPVAKTYDHVPFMHTNTTHSAYSHYLNAMRQVFSQTLIDYRRQARAEQRRLAQAKKYNRSR